MWSAALLLHAHRRRTLPPYVIIPLRVFAYSVPEDYNHLGPIAVAICALVCILTVKSTKGSSLFNYIAPVIHIVVILFIIIAGLTKADTKNYAKRSWYLSGFGCSFLFFAYTGFDTVSTMAEEAVNPAKDIPNGHVGSMFITTVAYCLL